MTEQDNDTPQNQVPQNQEEAPTPSIQDPSPSSDPLPPTTASDFSSVAPVPPLQQPLQNQQPHPQDPHQQAHHANQFLHSQQVYPAQYTQNSGYQQPPYQQPAYPQQPPYNQQPAPYPQPTQQQPPKKSRVWLWVLLGILAVVVLSFGGCVACSTLAFIGAVTENSTSVQEYPESPQDSYPEEDFYEDNSDTSNPAGMFTLKELQEAFPELQGTIDGTRATAGVYTIGSTGDLPEGFYFLEGSPTEEGYYYLFEYDESSDYYTLEVSMIFFGNYFVELDENDLLVFGAPDSSYYMYPESELTPSLETTLSSGLYRVGTDIPAGTYNVSGDEVAYQNASQDCTAFIMSDLDFNDNSIEETYYLLPGSTQTITVEEGDWLELYATTATLAQ